MSDNKTHKNVFGGYASSLVQQNFGETVNKHGFLSWDLKNGTVKEVDIYNPYSMHNVHIGKGTDYSNLGFIDIKPTEYTKIMVHWEDYISSMTRDNQTKIARYLKEKFNPTEIRYKRKPIDKGSEKVAVDDLRLDNISDLTVQQDIIRDYLKNLKHNDDTIAKLLDIDNTITRRLSDKGLGQKGRYDWRLLGLEINNFKSFGDDVKLWWDNKDGIWQISAGNQHGKSNLLMAFLYLAFGKTPDVRGREKFSDNRYINFKRNEDFTDVSGILEVNSQYFKLVRTTTREWKRSKGVNSIKAVPTVITYHRLDNNFNIIEDESVDKRKETEKIIIEALGNYDDFIRSSYISSDSLNYLLNIDYSQFLDSLLRDIGLDIFEKKLEEFKIWRKEVFAKLPRFNIDIVSEENKVKEAEESIKLAESEILLLDSEIHEANARLTKGRAYKDEQLTKLFPVDESLTSLTKESIQLEINALLELKDQKESEEVSLSKQLAEYSSKFNEEEYNELKLKERSLDNQIRDKKVAILDIKNQQEQIRSKIGAIGGRVELSNRRLSAIPKQEEQELDLLKRNIALIHKEIKQLEESTHCITCKRIKDDSTVEAINLAVEEKHKSIGLVNDDIITVFGRYDLERQNIVEEMEIEEERIIPLRQEITDLDNRILNVKAEREILTDELVAVGVEIKSIDLVKAEVSKRAKIEAEINLIPIHLEKLALQIEVAKQKFHAFVRAERIVADNAKIRVVIDKTDERINELEMQLAKLAKTKSKLEHIDIPRYKSAITEIGEKIDLYREQEQRDYIHKLYEDCFHRDGIPATILSKSLKFINKQLSELLDEVSFTIFIDEDFNFKMNHNDYPEHTMNVLSGCGMERTFASLVLRLALRLLNNKSRGNMLFLDEVMGMLDYNNFAIFVDLLTKSKTQLEKIVIIEHKYGELLHPDYMIKIELDEDGVSSLVLE